MPFVSRYASGVGNGGGKPGICWASIFQANGGKKKEVGVKRPRVSNRLTFFFEGGICCVFLKEIKKQFPGLDFFLEDFRFLFLVGCESKLPKKKPC